MPVNYSYTQNILSLIVDSFTEHLLSYKNKSFSESKPHLIFQTQTFSQSQISKFFYESLQLQQESIELILKQILNSTVHKTWLLDEIIKAALDIQFIVVVSNNIMADKDIQNGEQLNICKLALGQLENYMFQSCFFIKSQDKKPAKQEIHRMILQIDEQYGNKGYLNMWEYKNFIFSRFIDRYVRRGILDRKFKKNYMNKQIDVTLKKYQDDKRIQELDAEFESDYSFTKSNNLFVNVEKNKQFSNISFQKLQKQQSYLRVNNDITHENLNLFSFSDRTFDSKCRQQSQQQKQRKYMSSKDFSHEIVNKDYSKKVNYNKEKDKIGEKQQNKSKNYIKQDMKNSLYISFIDVHIRVWENFVKNFSLQTRELQQQLSAARQTEVFKIKIVNINFNSWLSLRMRMRIMAKIDKYIPQQKHNIYQYLMYLIGEERFKQFHDDRIKSKSSQLKIYEQQFQMLIGDTFVVFFSQEQKNKSDENTQMIEFLKKKVQFPLTYNFYLSFLRRLSEIPLNFQVPC